MSPLLLKGELGCGGTGGCTGGCTGCTGGTGGCKWWCIFFWCHFISFYEI